MSTENSAASSTKQLKPVLGFWDLMGAAVGQIIGAGIMTLMGSAIAMTGRSVPLAFLIAAVITVLMYFPLVVLCGTVRLRGGTYTMTAMLAGKKAAGAYSIIFIFQNLSLSMYALSFASYFVSLLGFGNEQVIAFIVLTLFFVLNCLGIDKFAAVQNLIVACLVIALAVFAAFGVGQIEPGYFASESWMTGGMMGLMQAGGLLTFAVGGANCIANLSAEAKRPTIDLPLAMIVSTLFVAVLYGIIAFVAAGVLPVDQVAGQNLSLVAQKVLAGPIYVFFMICGAGFALISTLNSQFAWGPKPTMQACDDGWLPAGLAKLSRWNTPIILLGVLYVLGVVCIISGLDVSVLGNMSLIANGVMSLLINMFLWKLPQIVPGAWNNSKFKMGSGLLNLLTLVGSLAALFNIFLNASTLSRPLQLLNVVVIVGSFIFAHIRSKHVTMDISYESV